MPGRSSATGTSPIQAPRPDDRTRLHRTPDRLPRLAPGDDGALVPWALPGSGAWEPGANTAVCHAGRRHTPPAADCMCGLYALASEYDHRLHGRDDQIVGAIAAWGDIELHRTGFRAEHAAVVALAEPEEAEAAQLRGRPLRRAARPARRAGADRAPLRPADRPFAVPRAGERARPAAHIGETGIALVEHVWCQVDAALLTIGVMRGFAGLLDDGTEITMPPPGTRIEARDPLATLHTPPRHADRMGVRERHAGRAQRARPAQFGEAGRRSRADRLARPDRTGRLAWRRAQLLVGRGGPDLVCGRAGTRRARRGRLRRPARRADLRRAAHGRADRHRGRAAPPPRGAALQDRRRRLRRLRRARARADRADRRSSAAASMRSSATA